MTDSFWDSNDQPGAVKAGFLGFAGTGKTVTAALLACAARERLGLTGPVAFFDTETGSSYVRNYIRTLTGQEPLVKRARSLADLLAFVTACRRANVSCAIVDSITHVWREVCDGYLKQKNEARRMEDSRKSPLKRLDFGDWNVIKPRWQEWSDVFLNDPLSILVCGRAGWEYETTVDEESGKKEINKSGVKMKVEGEFGFEPSLVIEFEAIQDLPDNSKVPTITRRLTVLKDRFSVLDAKSVTFDSVDMTQEAGLRKAYAAVSKFFAPHLALLTPGGHTKVNTDQNTDFGMGADGDAQVYRERREREILCEEIQGEITLVLPGQSAQEKKAKVEVLKAAFDTSSWTSIEAMSADRLRAGKAKLAGVLDAYRVPAGVPAVAPAAVPAQAPELVPAAPAAAPAAVVVPPAPKPTRKSLDI